MRMNTSALRNDNAKIQLFQNYANYFKIKMQIISLFSISKSNFNLF